MTASGSYKLYVPRSPETPKRVDGPLDILTGHSKQQRKCIGARETISTTDVRRRLYVVKSVRYV